MTSESDYEPSEEEEERVSERIDEPDNSLDEFNGMYNGTQLAAMMPNFKSFKFQFARADDDDVEFGEEGNEDGEDDEDDVSNFLNDVGDPLAAIEGLGLSDDAFAKFVRSQKKKHQDRRLSRRLRTQAGGSQPGNQTVDREEDYVDEEDDATLWMHHGHGGDGDDDFQEDPWSDALAESFGLTPAMSRKQEKRRQQAKIKKLKRGKMAKDRSGLPEVAKAKLGDGNLKYVAGDYEAAAELFMDCIRLAPQFPDAYSSLSRLYEEIGDHKKSLNFLMFAAHLTKKDSQIWKDAVIKSKEQGMLRQAIYCINQVIRRERDDADWRYERGMLLAELEENRKALVDLEYYWSLNPENPEVIKQITRLYFRLDKLEDAKQAIQKYISEFPENIDLTHVNLLAELFVNPALSNWEEVLALLEQTKQNHLDESEDMPIELESKGAIAMVHLGEVDKGTERLQQVLEQPVEVFADVYAWVASELEAMGHSHAALPFLKALSYDPSTSSMEFWKRYAEVAEEIHGLDGCIDAWQGVLKRLSNIHPEFVDAVIELTDAYSRKKDISSASSTLDLLSGAAPYASGTVYIPESTYLKRAKVIKLCNKSDTFVKMFYEPVLKTLNCILNSPESASKNRRRKKGKGKDIDGSDFFVWQTSQERRRRNSSKDKEKTELDALDDENKTAILELESLFEDVPVLENLLKGDQNFGVVLHLAKALISERKIDEAIEISQLSVLILGKKCVCLLICVASGFWSCFLLTKDSYDHMQAS
jgi:tetratricopeptide (TPR) repeat protein